MRAIAGIVLALVVVALPAAPDAAAAAVAAPVAAAPSSARLVRDINPSGGSDPRTLTRVGPVVFFSANDGSHGRELWSTDGSPGGTRMVRDIRAGVAGSMPESLTRVGNRLFFTAADGSHGRELWVSDGTKAGTRLVRDLAPGSRGSSQVTIVDRGGEALVSRDFQDLWRSDGTSAGTLLLRRFADGVDLGETARLDGRLYFAADGGLWRTDGTVPGTRFVAGTPNRVAELVTFRSRLYISEFDYPNVPRLWWSDGTTAGTRRLAGIAAPLDLTVLDGSLYFNAATSTTARPRLFRGNGSVAGTVPAQPRVRPFMGMVKAIGRLWAVGASRAAPWHDQLWSSDGSPEGTHLVYGGTGDWFTTDDGSLALLGVAGRIWFVAGPGALVGDEWSLTDHELWSSDGTTAGTVQAADINPTGSSRPRALASLGRVLLFGATDGTTGRELWAHDIP